MTRTAWWCVLIGASGLTVSAALLFAGPLNPPGGPVSPTYKTLSEVEPRIPINAANTPGDVNSVFRITQRGSYYLTGNVNGVSGKHGIEVAASGVTIDLGGFALWGVSGSLDGITMDGPQADIVIRNGSVSGWGDKGIDLFPPQSGEGVNVSDVVATGNMNSGIYVPALSVVTNCQALNTLNAGGYGIGAGPNSVITNCAVHVNSGAGIFALAGSTISNCTANQNSGVGIQTAAGCAVSACTARGNGNYGMLVESNGSVRDCSAYENTSDGILLGSGAVVLNCSSGSNNGSGFVFNVGGSITGCTAFGNVEHGITADDCLISGNTAEENGLDGIRCHNRCLVLNNMSNANGLDSASGAAINATGVDNRLEGNNCATSDRGIEVAVGGNILFRNTCSNNGTNWVIAANNVFGPIVDRRGPGSAAVSGNAAPDSSSSSHPNANFSY